MSAPRIARLDARRLARSPGLWIGAASFSLLVLAGTVLPALVLGDPAPDVGAAFLLGPAVDLVLPVVAIILTYASVAGLHADGRIKILVGTPVRRRQIVAGLTLSRIAAGWAIAFAGILAGLGTILALYGIPPLGSILAFALLTMLATASYVCIGIGLSALLGTPTRAIATSIAGFVVAHSLWEPLCRGLSYLVRGEFPADAPPRWFEPLVLASPLEAYTRAAHGLLPASPHLDIALGEGGAQADAGAMVGGEIAGATLGIAIASLILWGIGGLVVGITAFEATEIE